MEPNADTPTCWKDTVNTHATPELVVVIGAGSMGQAIARRVGVGKTILLADLNGKAAAAAAEAAIVAGRYQLTMGG
jgi:predicted dinucleotide-binding enzyme